MKDFFALFGTRLILFEDMHTYTFHDKLLRELELWDIRYGVSMYDCPEFDAIRENHNWVKTAILPHHFDAGTFKFSPGVEKKYDILIYGDLGSAYPFRRRLYELVCKNMQDLKLKFVRRPGYMLKKGGKFCSIDVVKKHRRLLAKGISQSRLCVATKSKFDYFVCKYLEIPAAGSVVVGDLDKLGKKILGEDACVYVHAGMTNKAISAKIRRILANPTELETLQRRGRERLEKYSTQDDFVPNLLGAVSDLVGLFGSFP
jgi:hypothetical protein